MISRKVAKVFLAGLLISFIGSLPLGTLNVAIFQLSIVAGVKSALWFAMGCVVVEIIYVRLSLIAMQWIAKHQKVLKWMSIISFLLTLTLAIFSFLAAGNGNLNVERMDFTKKINPFLYGLSLSAINPAQFPFWFGFSAILLSKKILLPLKIYYNWYISGIAIGSVMASCLFIFGGQYAFNKLGTNQKVLSLIIGTCFLIAALFQLWRLSVKAPAIER